MAELLERILAVKRDEVARLVRERADAPPPPPSERDFAAALRRGRAAVIAEIKRHSPSAGELRAGADPAELARTYADCGAAAISVLTDARFFRGSFADLRAVRGAVDLPLLCKDFVVDPVQIAAARSAGADAVLLIVRALDRARIESLAAAARELGMDCLVEVHDRAELDVALAAGASIIGINNRDLGTFAVDLETTLRLRPHVPGDRLVVCESGVAARADVDRVAAHVDAVLVGTALVTAADVRARYAELFGARRTP